uniref:Polycomb protein VEFS-Box domain-containing protein n=1 Tax=Acrobeloides nanus TaxID=290746 RepID=A0A914D7J3_9BILA
MPFKAKKALFNQANALNIDEKIKDDGENSSRKETISLQHELPKLDTVVLEVSPLPTKSGPKDFIQLIQDYRKIYDLTSKQSLTSVPLSKNRNFLRRTHLFNQLRTLPSTVDLFERFAAFLNHQCLYKTGSIRNEAAKRQRLEDKIVKLKKKTATDLEYKSLSVKIPGYNVTQELSGDYITFGFFDVKAPHMHDFETAHFDVFIVLLSSDQQIIFTERLLPFICTVSPEKWTYSSVGVESHVQEYWIPKGLGNYGELYLLVRGSMKPRTQNGDGHPKSRVKAPQLKLGNLSLKPQGETASSAPISSASTEESQENLTQSKKRGQKRKNSIELSGPKNGKIVKKQQKSTWEFPEYTLTPFAKKSHNRRQRSSTVESNGLPMTPRKSMRSPSKQAKREDSNEDNSEIVLYGTKLVANWKDGNSPPKQLRIHFGKTAVHLVNSNELRISGRTNAVDWKPTDAELISKIAERQKARGQYDNPKIVIELSNEHGIGVESSDSDPPTPHRNVKSQPKLSSKNSPSKNKGPPAIMYEFIDFMDDFNNENLIRANSKDSTPSSDHSVSATTSTSSGYGSYTSGISEGSGSGTPSNKTSKKRCKLAKHSPSKDPKLSTLLDQLDHETDRYARREGTNFLRCIVCSRTFPTTQTLMLHLELSYPAFLFQTSRIRENVIEVSFRNAYQTQISSKLSKILEPESTELLYKQQVRCIRHFYLTGKLAPETAGQSLKKLPKEIEVTSENIPKLPAGVKFFEILPYTQPIYTELKNPPLPNLCGVEPDQNWMKDEIVRRLSEYTDVTLKEKEFFVLWNCFVTKRANRILGGGLIKRALEKFAQEHVEDLVERELVDQWILHLLNLARNSVISQEDLVYFSSLCTEPMDLKKKREVLKRSPRKGSKSPRKKSLRPNLASPTRSTGKTHKFIARRVSPRKHHPKEIQDLL